MKRVDMPLPRGSKAFTLLMAELTLLAEQLAGWLHAPQTAPGVLAALKGGCHRAKGGAGFFGLDGVALIAAELEKCFAEERPAPESIRPLCLRLKEALAELGAAGAPAAPAEKQGEKSRG